MAKGQFFFNLFFKSTTDFLLLTLLLEIKSTSTQTRQLVNVQSTSGGPRCTFTLSTDFSQGINILGNNYSLMLFNNGPLVTDGLPSNVVRGIMNYFFKGEPCEYFHWFPLISNK